MQFNLKKTYFLDKELAMLIFLEKKLVDLTWKKMHPHYFKSQIQVYELSTLLV